MFDPGIDTSQRLKNSGFSPAAFALSVIATKSSILVATSCLSIGVAWSNVFLDVSIPGINDFNFISSAPGLLGFSFSVFFSADDLKSLLPNFWPFCGLSVGVLFGVCLGWGSDFGNWPPFAAFVFSISAGVGLSCLFGSIFWTT